MTRKGWCVGDGLYADGSAFAVDGYNSFVIQPMIWDVANVLARHGMKDGEEYVKKAKARLRRFADLQERMIRPPRAHRPQALEAFQMGDVAGDGGNGIILAQLQIGLKCLHCVHIVHRSVRSRRRSR